MAGEHLFNYPFIQASYRGSEPISAYSRSRHRSGAMVTKSHQAFARFDMTSS